MAGVTEQVVFQGVAAVTIFVIELQTAVLGRRQTDQNTRDCKTDPEADVLGTSRGCCVILWGQQMPVQKGAVLPSEGVTCPYGALETGLVGREMGPQRIHTWHCQDLGQKRNVRGLVRNASYRLHMDTTLWTYQLNKIVEE